jgi:hypothetical protein
MWLHWLLLAPQALKYSQTSHIIIKNLLYQTYIFKIIFGPKSGFTIEANGKILLEGALPNGLLVCNLGSMTKKKLKRFWKSTT